MVFLRLLKYFYVFFILAKSILQNDEIQSKTTSYNCKNILIISGSNFRDILPEFYNIEKVGEIVDDEFWIFVNN